MIDLSSLVEDGIKLINYIKKKNIEKYNSSIIIITDDVKILKKINENKFIFNYCLKFNDIEIINNLNNLVNENQERIPIKLVKNKIKIELEKLYFNFSYLGTKYLYECIYQCYYQKDYYNINLSKDIYPIISKRYNKSINSIKINIFQASYIMYCSNDKISLSKYFGYRIIEKPKTKDIIFIVLQKIKETIS